MGSTERMREYLDYKGITKYKFCNDLGFSNKFLDNSSNMGTDKACKILHHYPEINSEWLLTGNGPMVKEDNANIIIMNNDRKTIDSLQVSQEIPLYDLEAVAGLVPLFGNHRALQPVDHISIPFLPKCDGAVYVTGDSMQPLLKSGDIVMYKIINDIPNGIFWGEMYLLGIDMDGEEYITVKYIHRSVTAGCINLVSENPLHQVKEVSIDKIRALALIKASIRINAMK